MRRIAVFMVYLTYPPALVEMEADMKKVTEKVKATERYQSRMLPDTHSPYRALH